MVLQQESCKARSRTQVSGFAPCLMEGATAVSQLRCSHASAPAGTWLPCLLGIGTALESSFWVKERGQWEDPGVGKRTDITLRIGPSGPRILLLPDWRPEAERTLPRAPGPETALHPALAAGLSKTPIDHLLSTKPSWALQTLLVEHTLLTSLETSLEGSPTAWSVVHQRHSTSTATETWASGHPKIETRILIVVPFVTTEK